MRECVLPFEVKSFIYEIKLCKYVLVCEFLITISSYQNWKIKKMINSISHYMWSSKLVFYNTIVVKSPIIYPIQAYLQNSYLLNYVVSNKVLKIKLNCITFISETMLDICRYLARYICCWFYVSGEGKLTRADTAETFRMRSMHLQSIPIQ